MQRYEHDGQVWLTKPSRYVRYNGTPCQQLDLHGDFDGFKAPDTVVLGSERLGDGWMRYWLTSTNAELAANFAKLVELDEG